MRRNAIICSLNISAWLLYFSPSGGRSLAGLAGIYLTASPQRQRCCLGGWALDHRNFNISAFEGADLWAWRWGNQTDLITFKTLQNGSLEVVFYPRKFENCFRYNKGWNPQCSVSPGTRPLDSCATEAGQLSSARAPGRGPGVDSGELVDTVTGWDLGNSLLALFYHVSTTVFKRYMHSTSGLFQIYFHSQQKHRCKHF